MLGYSIQLSKKLNNVIAIITRIRNKSFRLFVSGMIGIVYILAILSSPLLPFPPIQTKDKVVGNETDSFL